jgi:cobalt-zinc-cadmium efflux system outer membrane protein
MRIRRPCVGLIALTLAGCGASHPQYSFDPPSRLSTDHRDHHEPHNNESVPKPSETKEVSLHGILAYADQNSPLLGISRAELLRGDAAISGTKPLFPSDPTVSLSAGPRIGADGTGLDVSLGLQQELEISGARGLRREAAERFHDVKSMEVEEVRWVVHRRVHALFHQALVARDRTIAATDFLTFAESLVSIAERRLKAGDISPLGVRVAQGELAQAKQAKIAADGAYRSVQITLAEVAGWPATQLPVPAGELDAPRKAPDQKSLLALAEQNNTRLQTRVAQTRWAEANQHLADRDAWPKPSVGLQYTRESDSAAGIGGGAEADVLLFGISLPIPLWRKNVAARSQAKAEVMVAQATHTAERQRLTARVLRAANQVDVGADRIAAYGSEILPTFEKNLTMLRRAFELGEIEVLDVSVAQRRFLEIQQSALTAYQEYYQAVSTLEQVVGAEVWPEERHDAGESE